MCGVAAIIGADWSVADLEAMMTALAHRGPDGQGWWASPTCALAHTRLAIIDPGGPGQPLVSVDGRHVLVFNGEITNYRELRRSLTYPFRTSGDTEVLLAGLMESGPAFLKRVQGQFAFVWHDTSLRRTVLGRDHSGILPLHWSRDEGRIVAASTIGAVTAILRGSRSVDPTALEQYLTYRSVHAPLTMVSGVRKVRPGHLLTITAEGEVAEQRYWEPPPCDLDISPLQAVDLVERTLLDAVESALVADVPVGAYLSGGVDSSLIVALTRQLRPHVPLHTFSAGFMDAEVDEIPWSTSVATALGTQHHVVRVTSEDFLACWPLLTRHRDAPLSEPADVAVYLLARRARDHVRVILSGEGSDELFAGYPKYLWERHAHRIDRLLPASARRFVEQVASRSGLPPRARSALRSLSAARGPERRAAWFAPFTPAERARLLGRPVTHTRASSSDIDHELRAMLVEDFTGWLPDNLLERGDRMTMAASVELRPPFLDPRLIDLAFRLPERVKLRGHESKWVVRQVALRHLPPEVSSRPKAGFPVPLSAWFRGGLEEMARDLLLDRSSYVQEVLDRHMVEDLLMGHTSGRSHEAIRLWTLLSLEVWHRTVLRAPTSTPAAPAGHS